MKLVTNTKATREKVYPAQKLWSLVTYISNAKVTTIPEVEELLTKIKSVIINYIMIEQDGTISYEPTPEDLIALYLEELAQIRDEELEAIMSIKDTTEKVARLKDLNESEGMRICDCYGY